LRWSSMRCGVSRGCLHEPIGANSTYFLGSYSGSRPYNRAVVAFSQLRAALHENYQDRSDGHEDDQQPHPLPNRIPILYDRVLRRNIPPFGELGGSGFNEAVSPALDPANGDAEFLADRLNRFALQQAHYGSGLFVTGEPGMPLIRSLSRNARRVVRLHILVQDSSKDAAVSV